MAPGQSAATIQKCPGSRRDLQVGGGVEQLGRWLLRQEDAQFGFPGTLTATSESPILSGGLLLVGPGGGKPQSLGFGAL